MRVSEYDFSGAAFLAQTGGEFGHAALLVMSADMAPKGALLTQLAMLAPAERFEYAGAKEQPVGIQNTRAEALPVRDTTIAV